MLQRRSSRHLILVFLSLVAIFLIISCGDQSTFEAKGEVARKQLELFWIIFGLGAFVFVVVGGALIYSAFRFRRRPGDGIPKQVHGHTKLEIAWTIAPAFVLIGIAIPTLIVLFDTDIKAAPTDVPKVEVEVFAHQWWFEFRYPELGVVTTSELHVPVGSRVDLALHSDDVIHSFWVPNLAGKVDIVPQHVNEMWFIADETGIYKGQCAEFCGTAHAQMRFRVIVETQAEFDQWVANYTSDSVTPTGEAAQGASLFAAKGCILCHSKDGADTAALRESQRNAFLAGDPVVPGPNLTNFATRNTMAAGIVSLTEGNIKRWLTDPDSLKPGNRMADLAAVYNDPNFALTADEISALTAYLLTLYPEPTTAQVTPTPIIDPTPTPTPGPGAEPTATPKPTSTPTPFSCPVDASIGDQAAGQIVFGVSSSPITCATCHSMDGPDGLGPSFGSRPAIPEPGISARAASRVDGMSAEDYICQSILDPSAFLVPGFFDGVMTQNFRETLNDQQLADVIAYLLTLE